MTASESKPKLIYIGDPMCSWCYGIAEELAQTTEHYNDVIDLELVMGGLRAGGGEQWNDKFKEFLKHHWEDVGIRSGQPFSFKLLEKEQFNYDTEPSCRSIVVVQSIDESKALPFFKEVQKGFYLESRDPGTAEFYRSICSKLDIDFDQFKASFQSADMKAKTQQHFAKSQQMGVRSFPTIVLEHKGQLHLVASGYSTFDVMKEKIDGLLVK